MVEALVWLGTLVFAAQRRTQPPAHSGHVGAGPRPAMPWGAMAAIFVAAVGLGLLVAAWLTWERTRPADRRWQAGIVGIAVVLAIMVPALWLVAALADPGAGLVAFASSVAGCALLRSGASV